MGDEGGFPLVSVFDTDIVVTPPNVKLGKDFSVSEFIDEVRDCYRNPLRKRGHQTGVVLIVRRLVRARKH